MFGKHVINDISSYCHGELSAADARLFNEHLMACSKCRSEFERIKLGVKLAEQLPRIQAPDTLWPELEKKLQTAPARASWTPPLYFNRWQTRTAAAAVLVVASALGLWLVLSGQRSINQGSFWQVETIDGTPRIDSTSVRNKGKLAVGQWLETDGASRAQINVASIGQVQIDANTRVRLVETQPTEHRLELARGKMSARIWAPPRLFFVDTPSAVAADMGCAYTLEVDDTGASLLRVTSGWVALELKDRESMVPTGAACQTRPGVGPGTPYFEDASSEFRQALTTIDFGGNPSNPVAVDTLLKNSRARDTLTLWHLLGRVNIEERDKLYDKIAAFVPPPDGVTRDGILKLDQMMLDKWRDDLEPTWWSTDYVVPKKIAEVYWQMKNGINRRVAKLK
jgi:FecR-like protein/putative zinc finger protein